MQNDFQASFKILDDRISFKAPLKHYEDVQDSLMAFLSQLVHEIVPIEIEFSDAKIMSFIGSNKEFIKLCEKKFVQISFFKGDA